MSARKLKRRAMARMSWPVVTIKIPMDLWRAVPYQMRDYLMRKALNNYLKAATTREGQE